MNVCSAVMEINQLTSAEKLKPTIDSNSTPTPNNNYLEVAKFADNAQC
ncbi:MAG: hypothetical protein F6K24_06755 [Okeania sp. SIO2D1]|nr:hypothetical protein [Trichodesmium sp. MO_231.B1]NES64969.1 hypothetical protein [Okeania sp. SIO2D1]